MKTLNEPSYNFNLDPPSYRELTKVIMKMKSGTSPCPLDQISVILFKKCPHLRTFLWRIISSAWTRAEFPKAWKQGITILVYKKGSDTDPANFRPTTLQLVMSKIFTSIIRNRLYNFVAENKYIKNNVQKRFCDDISGCYEHTEVLINHVINHARKKQRDLVVTLVDLKSAFGEIDHKLLAEVLKYHKVPDHMISLITSLYTDYFISVATDSYLTSPIKVRHGVLQGDSLSPLLFNLIVNTLITTINKKSSNVWTTSTMEVSN